jgi:hypothetical protein
MDIKARPMNRTEYMDVTVYSYQTTGHVTPHCQMEAWDPHDWKCVSQACPTALTKASVLKFLLPKIVTKIHVPYRDMYTKYNKMIM